MNHQDMDRLIGQHIAAEEAGDVAAAVAVYTNDVEHDLVGFPTGPVHGKTAASGFYDYLTKNIDTEKMLPTRTFYAEDACIMEHLATGTVNGDFLGIPGNGRQITFRMIHVWEFRDGLICRENIWLDGASIAAQLTSKAAGISP